MKSILSYILSAFYGSGYLLTLLIFHPIQAVCYKIGGAKAHKKSVDVMNYFLLYGIYTLGCTVKLKGFDRLPKDRPLIVVSNHQSFMDISPMVIGLRKHSPKFVSKIELGKGIPSISYNLRKGGSALIDRKNPRQSIAEIMKLGRHIEDNNYCACIFPEGTRSKMGKVGRFQHAGIASLLKFAPSALLVPMAIEGNSKLCAKGHYPLTFGTKLRYTALEAIDPAGKDIKELTAEIELIIKKELGQE